ncbi:CBO0543 family protein [Virgibacillus halophilus]|uniref:CBO0543 family protein n=1 Tax=Tigheibacillus halophilus TaxID=361280 RepID=UPI00362A93A7
MILSVITFMMLLVWLILSNIRLSRLEIYSTIFFATTLAYTVDHILGLNFRLYWYAGLYEMKFQDFIIVLGLYPLVNILFLNYFPGQKKFIWKIVYLLIWSLFALGYEWLAVQTGSFKHTGWKFRYSAPSYPVLYLILFYNLKFVRWLQRKG